MKPSEISISTAQPADPRPEFHFTPNAGWINDPNGLVYLDGEYHLFYQHHPSSTVWGPMHWGHAVSRDLVQWEELPVALAPDDIGAIFSGSAVLDKSNSAGFGANAMIAIFTHHSDSSGVKQRQSLAFSTDRGRTWTKYAGNPVLVPPNDEKDFRDPKVFWHESGGHWVMALAVAKEIWFYRSNNLKDWELSSTFGATFGSHGGVWECPELVRLPVEGTDEQRWVLIVSVGNGAPAGGSGVQYFVGDFDGRTFTSQDAPERVRWADYGGDFYAAQAWNDSPDGRTILIAWMNNWAYANKTPDSGGRRGAMSLARDVSLVRAGDDVTLRQRPVTPPGMLTPVAGWAGRPLDANEVELGSARMLSVTFAIDATTASDYFGVKLRGATGASAVIGFNVKANKLIVNRAAAGPREPGFVVPHIAPLEARDGRVSLQLIIDQTSVEVFADDGRLVMTEQVFLGSGPATISLFADSGAVTVEQLAVAR